MKRELTEAEGETIAKALLRGDRIEAISCYIAATDAGLTQAQNYVNSLASRIRETQGAEISAKKKRFLGIF